MNASETPRATRPSVLVIGAGGALGTLVVDSFHRAGWAVHRGGRIAGSAPDFRYVDLAAPATVPPALEGVDLVVSTVPDSTLTAERHVLAHGGAMINVSAGPAAALTELREEAGTRGTVLMNAGIAPGVTNLVAASLLEEHPDADELEMVFTVTTKGSGGKASGDFAHRGLTRSGRHRVATVALAPPFGTQPVLGFAESDQGWLGAVASSVTVRTYLCLAERPAQRVMLALNRTGLIARLPRAAFRTRGGPTVEGASREPVAHQVTALSGGKQLATRTIRGSGDFRMAADSTVLFAEALLGRDGGPRVEAGAWSPEEVLTLPRLAGPMAAAGISVEAPEYGCT